MPDDAAALITQILADPSVSANDRAQKLLPLMYEQLRGEAQRLMDGERAEHTLQPTALVHEAYLRLIGERDVPWQNRAHFYAAAAEAMRRILIDHAKARGRLRRGGGARRVPLNLGDVADFWNLDEILSLDDAIHRLEEQDPALAEVVRMRFYAGLSVEATADALRVSPATVKRRWEYGRTWLFRALSTETDHEAASTDEPGR
jgi:RNA polymerase sigma factor (TIGR02999 family)